MIKYNVKVRQQVKDYLDSLGPEPRHRQTKPNPRA